MDGRYLAGIIITIVVSFGCGMLFYGIGLWAEKGRGPMNFWSGTTVDPRTISDIPAYNHACGQMWKRYSIPYWLAGLLGIAGFWRNWLAIFSGALSFLGATAGIVWLVCNYLRIEKTFKIR